MLHAFALLTVLLAFLFIILPSLFDKFANRVQSAARLEVSEQARSLHETLWIADLHSDALLWNRDLSKRNHRGHVDFPRLVRGRVALQVFTVVSKVPFGLNLENNDDQSDMVTLLSVFQHWPVRTWRSLLERARFQSQKLHDFASTGGMTIIKTKRDLEHYVDLHRTDPATISGLLGLEGAQVLEGNPDNLQVLFDAGFRMMAPTHFFDTDVGGSAHGVRKGALTALGRKVISEMQRIGMLVDVAHASEETIDDIVNMSNKPIVNSHTGVRGTCDNQRNLKDEQLLGIARTGGVIGIGFFPSAVCGEGIENIIRAIRYTTELVGVEHVGLGSDFDGTVTTPINAAGMIQITEGLLQNGFDETEIRLIMGGNVQRVLLEVLP